MLLETPETLSDDYTTEESAVNTSPADETISVDEANTELQEVGQETQAEADSQADEATAAKLDEDEKKFWREIELLKKITDCSENIEDHERSINDLKEQIKVEKECLKGEQHRLQKLAIKLRAIREDKPLPVDPNARKDERESASDETIDGDGETAGDDNASNWRVMETGQLLDGLKGLGKKKLDALVDAAPTVGDLEDLRGEASKAHQAFREMLPSGFGQKIADAIEDRLIEHVAKCSKSAEEQAAEERESESGEEPTEGKVIAGKIEQREHDQIHGSDDDYEDVDDDDETV